MNNSLVKFARRLRQEPRASTLPTFCSFYSSSSPSSYGIFVTGFSWKMDERSLTDAFSPYGKISEVRIVYNNETGRSRGFGFVYFAKEDEARRAKDAMDGKAYLGHRLRISYALERARGTHVVIPRLKNAAGWND